MIFKFRNFYLFPICSVIFFTPRALAEANCTAIERSSAEGRALSFEGDVVIAINKINSQFSKSKNIAVAAKRKIQSLFIDYCRDYSGFKSFQIEVKGGVSGTYNCSGGTFFVFKVAKSDITIKEIINSDDVPVFELPEMDDRKGLFEVFK